MAARHWGSEGQCQNALNPCRGAFRRVALHEEIRQAVDDRHGARDCVLLFRLAVPVRHESYGISVWSLPAAWTEPGVLHVLSDAGCLLRIPVVLCNGSELALPSESGE